MTRRDVSQILTGPECAANGERQLPTMKAVRDGAIRWFNLRQEHAAGSQPNAMQLAMANATQKKRLEISGNPQIDSPKLDPVDNGRKIA